MHGNSNFCVFLSFHVQACGWALVALIKKEYPFPRVHFAVSVVHIHVDCVRMRLRHAMHVYVCGDVL